MFTPIRFPYPRFAAIEPGVSAPSETGTLPFDKYRHSEQIGQLSTSQTQGRHERGPTYFVLFLGLVQGDMLPYEDSDPDAREVEPIQKLVDLWEVIEAHTRQLLLQLSHPHGHHRDHIAMPENKQRIT